MRELNLRNITMMALVASCLIQIGAQLFALTVVASTVSAAPPRSFAILTGEYRYDSSAFWEIVPMITALLFVIALVANWKTPRRLWLAHRGPGLAICSSLVPRYLYGDAASDDDLWR